MAGAMLVLLAGSATAETLSPLREADGEPCAADRRSADGPAGGCLRINGYIAASADVPSEAPGGQLFLNRPRGPAPRVDFGPAVSEPGFLPAKSDAAR